MNNLLIKLKIKSLITSQMRCARQMSNELEVVLQANTQSYIGFGWKPSGN